MRISSIRGPFLILAFLFLSRAAGAQKTISEAVLQYSVSVTNSNGAAVNSPLNGSTLSVFLTPNQSAAELASAPGKESALFNNSTGRGFILKEYSGQKLAITLDASDWAQSNARTTDLHFDIQPGSFPIAGHTCKLATAVAGNRSISVYYDPAITVANKTYQNAFPQVPGLPVKYRVQEGQIVFAYQLTALNPGSVDAAKFSEPKTGYRVMTYAENKQLKKGM